MVAAQYKITNASMFPLEAHSKNQHAQDAVLSKLEQDMTKIVKQFIKSRLYVKTFIDSKIDKLFYFRITSLNWLIKNRITYTDWEMDLEATLSDLKTNNEFSFLYKNILFAIKTNIRCVNSLIPPSNIALTDRDSMDWQPIPKQSFKEHIHLMRLTALPFDLELYQAWIIASLQIEFVVATVVLIQEQKMVINHLKINELAIFVVNAAQTFERLTQSLKGIYPKQKMVDTEPFLSEFSFLTDNEAWQIDESPFDIEEMIEKHAIQWEHLPLVQKMFEDAPFDDMEKCLDS